MHQRSSWTVSKIGEYCLVGDGAHAKIQRQESGVMYLSSKNFKPEGMDLSKVEFISEEDFERYFRKTSKALTKPEPSDVLVGIIGSLGEPYVVRPSDRFGLSSSVAIIRPRRDVLLPEYLYYWMKSSAFQRAVYAPIISNLPELTTLLLNGNDLNDLPNFLTTLPRLTQISIGNNCKITQNEAKMKNLRRRFPKVTFDFTDEYDCPAK